MNEAEKLAQFQQLIQEEFPTARVEVVDGMVWVAVGQGENRRVIKLSIEMLDAPPAEVLKHLRSS